MNATIYLIIQSRSVHLDALFAINNLLLNQMDLWLNYFKKWVLCANGILDKLTALNCIRFFKVTRSR